MNGLTKVMCGLLPASFVVLVPEMALAQQTAQSAMVCYAVDNHNRAYYFTETMIVDIPAAQGDQYSNALHEDFGKFIRARDIYSSQFGCVIFPVNGALPNGLTLEGWKQIERDNYKIYNFSWPIITDYRPKDIVPLPVAKAPPGADSGKRDSLIVRQPDEAPRPVAKTTPKPAAKRKPAVAAKPAPKKKSSCRVEGTARFCKAVAR